MQSAAAWQANGPWQAPYAAPPAHPPACLPCPHWLPTRSLARRLSGLEHQLESLDEGTKEVLRQSAGGWLGALGDAVQDAAAPIEEAAAAAGAAENGGGAAGSQQGGGGQ